MFSRKVAQQLSDTLYARMCPNAAARLSLPSTNSFTGSRTFISLDTFYVHDKGWYLLFSRRFPQVNRRYVFNRRKLLKLLSAVATDVGWTVSKLTNASTCANMARMVVLWLEDKCFWAPAQKHLFHISSTKDLRPGIYASMTGDPKKTILKFSNSAHQPGVASKYP